GEEEASQPHGGASSRRRITNRQDAKTPRRKEKKEETEQRQDRKVKNSNLSFLSWFSWRLGVLASWRFNSQSRPSSGIIPGLGRVDKTRLRATSAGGSVGQR